MNIPAHICRRLVKVLSRVDDPEAVALVEALGPRRRKVKALELPGKSRAERAGETSAAKEEMHSRVWAWNLAHTAEPGAIFGRCDCGCGYPFRHMTEGECDHWINQSQGGPDTRENGWRLRGGCHAAKHGPNRDEWNRRRAAYCLRAGIPFVPRRVRG